MTQYAVDPGSLDGLVSRMQSYAPESAAYGANVAGMNAGRGAFTRDEENRQFDETVNSIAQQHLQIAQMYQNVAQRLASTAQNYRNADQSSSQTA